MGPRPVGTATPRAPILVTLAALALLAVGSRSEGEPPANQDSWTDLTPYAGLEEYRFGEEFVARAVVRVSSEAGSYTVVYEGRDLFVGRRVEDPVHEEVFYDVFAARVRVRVAGDWQWESQHAGPFGEVWRDTTRVRQPVFTVQMEFKPAALRRILQEGTRSYQTSLFRLWVRDRSAAGNPSPYGVTLGGYQRRAPDRAGENALRLSSTGDDWSRRVEHHHPDWPGSEESFPPQFGPFVVGLPRSDVGVIHPLRPQQAGWQGELTVDTFDPLQPVLRGQVSQSTRMLLWAAAGGERRVPARVELSWNVSPAADVDASLSPVEPTDDDVAGIDKLTDYRVRLPSLGAEAVRVRLRDGSAWTGVATNAGYHALHARLGERCPHTNRPVELLSYEETPEPFHGRTLRRQHLSYNACPIDSLPDVFFRDTDNPGWEIDDPLDAPELIYRAGTAMHLDHPDGREVLLRAISMDGAAEARLSAEVLVGGVWVDVPAEGPTATPVGDALMIPVDVDRNHLADVWQDEHRVDDPRFDGDDNHHGGYPGDGLTAFEEYRGFVGTDPSSGAVHHARLDPRTPDLFVHDYTGELEPYVLDPDGALGILAAGGVRLHTIASEEFYDAVINFQDTPYRAGEQFVVMLMRNPVTPQEVGYREFFDTWSGWGGLAATVGPPTREHHTALVQHLYFGGRTAGLAELIAHEIGHQINVPHHGSATLGATTPGSESLATRHDQLSGQGDCVMRYRVAEWFCESGDWEQCRREGLLRRYPCSPALLWQNRGLCETGLVVFGTSAEGSGINADDAWGGAAAPGRGNCAAKIRVRSY